MIRYSSFAFYVRLARSVDGLSQQDLARAARLTLNEVIALEAGILRPRLWQVLLMADFFGVDSHWFCRLAMQSNHLPEETPQPEYAPPPIPPPAVEREAL